jgi:hypothetical protein
VLSSGGAGQGPCPPPLGGACLGVLKPFVKTQRSTANASGVAHWSLSIPATVPVGADLWIQAMVIRGVTSNVEAHTTEP